MKKIFFAFATVTLLAASAFFMSCSDGSDSPAHEHNFSSEWTSNATHHWHVATCEHKNQVKEKAEHTFGLWKITVQPTEETEGKVEKECLICHFKTEENIAKLDHVHVRGETLHPAVEGSCLRKGKIAYYDCTKCEIKLDEDGNPLDSLEGEVSPSNHQLMVTAFRSVDEEYHEEFYICCGGVKTGNLPHIWDEGRVTKEPTTEEGGERTFYCNATCGKKKTETIAKLPVPPEQFVLIPAGVFRMGCNDIENGFKDNRPVHEVTLTKAFFMCDHEVTQGEYEAVMKTNPSYCDGINIGLADGEIQENRPVEQVTWYMAIVYCNKLSIKEELTPCYTINGKTDPEEWGEIPTVNSNTWNKVICNWEANGYRLPTEAEWEYAARAGDKTVDSTTWSGATVCSSFPECVWYRYTEGYITREVRKKKANAWGLYDMSGNVFEWCWDWWPASGKYSDTLEVTDPRGDSSGTERIARGGCFESPGSWCTVSYRSSHVPYGLDPDIENDYLYDTGFRVCRNVEGM